MKATLVTMMLLFTMTSWAKIKVAVIDTGLNKDYKYELCGIKDFTGTDVFDNHGHSTNISGIIHKQAKGSDYCQIILKFFDKKSEISRTKAVNDALRFAIDQKSDIINISLGGSEPNKREKSLIIEALNKGITIVAAAGNEGQEGCNYYPACYDSRIIVVGSSNQNGVRLDSSNYSSKVDAYMDGYEVKADGITHSGTSQSTAKMTGILVKALSQRVGK